MKVCFLGVAALLGGKEKDRKEKPLGQWVTRHTQISGEDSWRVLLVGVDTLDLGLYVHWGVDWERLRDFLDEQKAFATGREPRTIQTRSLGPCLVLPGGKAPMYRFHLQRPDCHLFIAVGGKPGKWPNVYVSMDSAHLRRRGVAESVKAVKLLIEDLGGWVVRIVPSRCDLAVDVHLPGGLTSAFLEGHGVGRSRKVQIVKERGALETFYVGGKGSDILLRIYDKAREIKVSGKEWLRDLWQYQGPDVWRFEFQIRRNVLRQFRVKSVVDLAAKLGGIWKRLTGEWYSLRLPGEANTTRRDVHPGWSVVQGCASRFGAVLDVKRVFESERPAKVRWYVSHGAGCFLGFAVLRGLEDQQKAAEAFMREILEHWRGRDFKEAYGVKAIKNGRMPGGIAP